MNNKQWFIEFMRDRYGIDDLSIFMLSVYLLILIINILVKWYVFDIISIILLAFIVYRVLSKNKTKRCNENIIYIKYRNMLIKPIAKKYNYIKNKYRDRDIYIYRRCKKCKTVLRLPIPSRRGIKYVKCPNCGNRYKYFILREQKIDIIRKRDK